VEKAAARVSLEVYRQLAREDLRQIVELREAPTKCVRPLNTSTLRYQLSALGGWATLFDGVYRAWRDCPATALRQPSRGGRWGRRQQRGSDWMRPPPRTDRCGRAACSVQPDAARRDGVVSSSPCGGVCNSGRMADARQAGSVCEERRGDEVEWLHCRWSREGGKRGALRTKQRSGLRGSLS
jgi:hypothetical protein